MNIDFFQKIIHRLEVGGGLRYLRIALVVFAFLVTLFLYDFWAYKNMGSIEAMDAAQLGRNIAQGKGYTTLFVRPFSIFLVQSRNEKLNRVPEFGNLKDPAQIRGMHPDISNPPLYPVVLAGLMSVLPFEYTIPAKPGGFWMVNGLHMRYQPDFIIALFNQVLFIAVVVLVFLLAMRLFGKSVAWISGIILFGTELLWRFSSSGLSTMLLMLILTLLVWCVVFIEQEWREPRWSPKTLWILVAAAGVLVGAATLTRYSMGFLIVPLIIHLSILGRRQGWTLGVVAFVGFILVFTPWVVRNYSVSGTPLGTATYAMLESSAQFPEHNLERSLHPDFGHAYVLNTVRTKLILGVRQALVHDLPLISGTWLSAFLLAGLFVVYVDPATGRLRWFLVSSVVMLALVQGAIRSQISEDVPELNSENLLVVLVPFLTMYGVNLFLLLAEQVEWPFRELRHAATIGFCVLATGPLIITVFLTRSIPLSYPPYVPASIQRAALWVESDELIMSDMPWAVAWYGQSQSVWSTLKHTEDFFAINDYLKSIQEVFLTPITMDSKFMSHWQVTLRGSTAPDLETWGGLILDWKEQDAAGKIGPPGRFPLPFWHKGFFPEYFFVTARIKPARTTLTPSTSESSPESSFHFP